MLLERDLPLSERDVMVCSMQTEIDRAKSIRLDAAAMRVVGTAIYRGLATPTASLEHKV